LILQLVKIKISQYNICLLIVFRRLTMQASFMIILLKQSILDKEKIVISYQLLIWMQMQR